MSQFTSIFLLVTPLAIGYLFKIKSFNILKSLNYFLNIFLYLILIFIGISLGQLGDLGANLVKIVLYSSAFLVMNFFLNFLFIFWIDKKFPLQLTESRSQTKFSYRLILYILGQVSFIVLGMIIALFFLEKSFPIDTVIYVFLMLMLFVVGAQLRSTNMNLKRILINKRGVSLAVLLVLSCMVTSILLSFLLDIPLKHSIALNSGYGWYSLSGGIITQAQGSFWGGIVILNDLGREVLAFIFIPLLMKHYPSYAIAMCGSTALDFTLPSLRQHGGIYVVPVAVCFSLILTIISPIFLTFFSR